MLRIHICANSRLTMSFIVMAVKNAIYLNEYPNMALGIVENQPEKLLSKLPDFKDDTNIFFITMKFEGQNLGFQLAKAIREQEEVSGGENYIIIFDSLPENSQAIILRNYEVFTYLIHIDSGIRDISAVLNKIHEKTNKE